MRRFTCLRSKRSIEKKVGLCWILIYHPLFIAFDVPISSVGSICSTVVCCSKAQWVERGIESDRNNDVRNTNMQTCTYINQHERVSILLLIEYEYVWIAYPGGVDRDQPWDRGRLRSSVQTQRFPPDAACLPYLAMTHMQEQSLKQFWVPDFSSWQICELHTLHALIHCPSLPICWLRHKWLTAPSEVSTVRRPWHHVVVLMGEKCGPINGNLPIEYPQMSIMEIYRL